MTAKPKTRTRTKRALRLRCSHTRADTLEAYSYPYPHSFVRIASTRRNGEQVPIVLSTASAKRLRDYLTATLRALPRPAPVSKRRKS